MQRVVTLVLLGEVLPAQGGRGLDVPMTMGEEVRAEGCVCSIARLADPSTCGAQSHVAFYRTSILGTFKVASGGQQAVDIPEQAVS